MEDKGEPGCSADKMSTKNLSPNKDDSLADFKSPKEQHVAAVKVKIVNDKRAKKLGSKSKTAISKKKENAAKEESQPSIESSFFKAAINARRDGHTCPLCMKYFADTASGVSHTKTCATKNKVSTKKLLAAVALQEKQAGERMAIGLPAGPIIHPKEKTARKPRDTVAKGDPDLQLALALSKSLQENQLEQEFEEALLLASEHRGDGRIIGFSSDSERKSTLKNFGFFTNKSAGVSEGPVRVRRKKHLGPTILQTRTQETRDRILTERIAEILMGNEAITQICQQEASVKVEVVKKRQIVLRSRLLQEIHRTTERLWDRAELSADVMNFYVEDLEPIIMPAVLEMKENPENQDNIEKPDQDKNKDASPDKSPVKKDEKLISKISASSMDLQQIQINEEAKQRSESSGLNNIYVTDREYRNTLSMDWARTLNVSSISDVVIIVENGHIWAHKLVFHVRCSDILLDCETNEFAHVKETISWPDVDLSTGLAFLEFVYSGLIEKNIIVFTDNRVAKGVRSLARKYRLKPLFDYLRKKKVEYEQYNDVTEIQVEDRKSGLRSPVIIQVASSLNDIETVQESCSTNEESNNIDENLETLPSESFNDISTVETNILSKKLSDNDSRNYAASVISVSSSRSAVSMSPDLFDDTTEEALIDTSKDEIESNTNLSDNDNTNLKVLADLIAQDDLSSASNMSENSQASTVVQDPIAEDSPSVECTKKFLSLSQGHFETPKSCNNSTKLNDRSRSQLFPAKQKSNLSLFIEKIQRINAKDALDSIEEGESLADIAAPKRRKNPFNVNDISNKSILDSSEKIKNKRKLCRNEKRGFSVFDEPVELKNNFEASKTNDESVDNTILADESSVVNDNVDTDEQDISMYSKYRKNNKHNNSISNYRDMLKKLTNVTDVKNDNTILTNEKIVRSPIEKSIDLTQESDTDVDIPQSSMSNVSQSSEHKSVSDASDVHSIRSALTEIAHHSDSNASGDDINDLEIENLTSAVLSSEKIGNEKNYFNSLAKSPSCEMNTKEKIRGSNSVVDNNKLNEIPEYSIDSTPESVKSLRKSPLPSYHDLLDEDNEIFNINSWKNKTHEKHSSNNSPLRESSERNEKRWEKRISSLNDNLETVKEAAQYQDTNVINSLGNSSKFPDLDVFEIDEEIFSNSVKKTSVLKEKSLRSSPKKSFDYTDKSASSRRKRRAEEKRTRVTSLVDNFEAKSSTNISDIDVDDLFTQSLKNTDIIHRRSLSPEENRRLDSPEKFVSLSSKRKSIDIEKNKSDKSLENSIKYPGFHYEVFEPDDNIFTQRFNYSPPPSCDAFSPNCDFPNEDCNSCSSLKVSSPIVISSSPEIDIDNEINNCNDERDCNKENTFADEQTSELSLRKNLENPVKSISPTILQRPTTPQPGTSKYTSNNRENLTSSAKSPFVRWNSMPTTSSNGNVSRKRSRTLKKSSTQAMSQQNVTPPVNYDVMDTPELTKELSRWGMKAQTRKRARKLLNHIYNELHSARSAPEENDSDDDIDVSEDDQAPPRKVSRPGNRTSEDSESDREIPLSQQSASSAASPVAEEMDFGDDNASSDDLDASASTSSIKKAFNALIKEDKDIHNQILTYAPLSLELLLMMLKARGLKCQNKDLMDFLDEECITFQVQSSQRKRTKKSRVKKTAPSGKKKAYTQKN